MSDQQNSQRLRIIRIHADFLQQILRAQPLRKHGLFRGYTSDAPGDLTLMGGCRHCAEDNTFEFVVSSETFEPVPEGTELPYWTPFFTSHYEDKPLHTIEVTRETSVEESVERTERF